MNPYAFRRSILSRLRLPFRHSRIKSYSNNKILFHKENFYSFCFLNIFELIFASKNSSRVNTVLKKTLILYKCFAKERSQTLHLFLFLTTNSICAIGGNIGACLRIKTRILYAFITRHKRLRIIFNTDRHRLMPCYPTKWRMG